MISGRRDSWEFGSSHSVPLFLPQEEARILTKQRRTLLSQEFSTALTFCDCLSENLHGGLSVSHFVDVAVVLHVLIRVLICLQQLEGALQDGQAGPHIQVSIRQWPASTHHPYNEVSCNVQAPAYQFKVEKRLMLRKQQGEEILSQQKVADLSEFGQITLRLSKYLPPTTPLFLIGGSKMASVSSAMK